MSNSTVQREDNGRLKKGSQLAGGISNPSARQSVKKREAFLDYWDDEKLAKVTTRLEDIIHTAPPGTSLVAIEQLLNRLWGKPKDTLELELTARPTLDMTSYTDQQVHQMLSILDSPPDSRPEQEDTPILILPEPSEVSPVLLPPVKKDKPIRYDEPAYVILG